MTIAKDFASKAAVAFVAVAMLFTMFAPSAKAQSSEDLQAMINNLLAQIAALQAQAGQGGSSMASGVCPYTWTRDLNVGAKGADVMKLQQFLNANADTRVAATGAGSVGAETEFYGPATAAAVSKMQVMYRAEVLSPAGLVNPTGYFGPSSRAKANSLCVSAPVVVPPVVPGEETPSTPSALEGGEGYLDFETLLDSDVTIDLGKSEEVLALEVEAKDSDVSINRVDFYFGSSTSNSSVRPWLYFDEVNLLVDGEEVASLSRSSDFSEVTTGGDSNYRARFSGLDIVVREDDKAEITLELVVLDSMAGTRADETVEVSMMSDSIRFMDGAGISDTTGTGIAADVSFTDTFGQGGMTLSIGDNSPENQTFVLNEKSRTSDVTVATFGVEAEDSDITVNNVTVVFDTTGDGVATTLYRAKLYAGSTLLSTKSVTGSSTIFTDVDYTIDEDDTADFKVVVEFNRGDGLAALSTPQDFIVDDITVDAEDADFSAVNDTLNVDETHTILVEGVVAEPVSGYPKVTKSNNLTDLTYSFEVTAYGKDFWISATSADAVTYTFGYNTASTTLTPSPTISVSGESKNASNNYKITKGQTKTVSVTYSFTNNGTALDYVSGQLDLLRYKTTATDVLVAGDLSVALGDRDFEVPSNTSVAAP